MGTWQRKFHHAPCVKLHHEGISQSSLAKMLDVSDATAERTYAEYNQRKAAERLTHQCPIILGIDEHTLHKKQRFATTFCDLHLLRPA